MRLIDVTMIGVGAMIGAGIFVLTGIAAGVAGPALVVVFLLNGFVALLTAGAYAELGSAIHGAGGGYLWIKRSLPDPSGFLSGWVDWFAHAVACSLYALGFGAYMKEVLIVVGLPEWHPPFLPAEIWFAVGACSLFAYINYRGASETGKAGSVVTIGKVVIIGGFIAAGLWAMANRTGWQGAFSPFLSEGLGGVFAAMGLTFIAFEGYEIIAQTSEEVEDPKRNIPRAVFLSLLIVVPIYMLVAFVAVGAVVPPEGMSVTAYLAAEKEVALVKAADQFMVGGGVIILVGGLLSTISALNATIYSSSRVAFAMARDASLPAAVARVHQDNLTPHYAILLSTVLIIGMAIALPIEQIAAAASVMFLLLFGAVNVALIRLRTLHPELDRGYRVPFVPFTPILAIVAMVFIAAIMFVDYPLAWAAAGGWIVLGVAFYYGYSRKRETAFSERTAWMERIERNEYRVLAAVYQPASVESLMAASTALAEKYQGDIVAVSVVEVPEGDSLLMGRRQARELQPILDASVACAAARHISATSVVKIGRRISHSLMQTAREEGCNFLVMGEPHRQSMLERLVSSSVERVLQDAPCQVGVVYGHLDPAQVKQILVPVTSGKNSELAMRLAPAFAARFDVPIRVVTVVSADATEAEAERHVATARETMEAAEFNGELEVLRRTEVSRALLRAMRKGTLVVIGAPSAGSVFPLIGETVPAEIAHRGRNPVIVVRDVEVRRVRRFERLFFARS
ncbi:MAG: amino acid permease [Acidobacteria bacterium]|nr:amino acid permease [Acidobacteriota bacterium]